MKVQMNELDLSVVLEHDVNGFLEAQLIEALMECYSEEAWYFRKQSWWHSKPSWRVIAQEEDGRIVGHFAVVLRDVQVGDKMMPVSVAGIQGVFVRQAYRGIGLSDRIMEKTMENVGRQNLDAGMLFCIPKLEALYSRMGWGKINAAISFIGESGEKENMEEKNIAMVYPVKLKEFPPGDIDLNGCDW